MIRYKAIAPARTTDKNGQQTGDLCFNEKTCGVRFNKGQAIFDDLTVDEFIGLTAAEVAQRMVQDFGYTVTKIDGDTGQEIGEVKAEAKAKKKIQPQPA